MSKKEKLIDKLNDDQVVALSDYITQEGIRKWRASLNDAWMTGRYTGGAVKYSHLLQQIRNKNFGEFGGPTFITKVSAKEVHEAAIKVLEARKPEKPLTTAELTRMDREYYQANPED